MIYSMYSNVFFSISQKFPSAQVTKSSSSSTTSTFLARSTQQPRSLSQCGASLAHLADEFQLNSAGFCVKLSMGKNHHMDGIIMFFHMDGPDFYGTSI